MADPKTFADVVVKYRVGGTQQNGIVLDKRTVVMPASYAADGHPVDLSGVFSSLSAITILRAYTTSTGAPDPRLYIINEIATDTFANRKFRIKVFNPNSGGTPTTGTDATILRSSAAPSTNNNVIEATNVITLNNCGVGCNAESINASSSGARKLSTANVLAITWDAGTTIDRVTAVTSVGTIAAAAGTEISATTNLSTITVEYLAEGVPA